MNERSLYDRIRDIHHWIKYAPDTTEYVKYKTNIIFTGIKISDLYSILCQARANLYYCELGDYGDISSKDDLSMNLAKSFFIQNALIYYNIAADYSWQVVWAYLNDTIADSLPTDDLYEDCLVDCDYMELMLGLTLKQEYKLREFVKSFFNKNIILKRIRPQYNYLKHRGTFFFNGLGLNDHEQSYYFSMEPQFYIDNNLPIMDKLTIPKVSRREIDLPEMMKLLEEFDNQFIEYCGSLFQMLLPKDYLSKTCQVTQIAMNPVNHFDEIISYNLKIIGKG